MIKKNCVLLSSILLLFAQEVEEPFLDKKINDALRLESIAVNYREQGEYDSAFVYFDSAMKQLDARNANQRSLYSKLLFNIAYTYHSISDTAEWMKYDSLWFNSKRKNNSIIRP